jgi:hypothetical protein
MTASNTLWQLIHTVSDRLRLASLCAVPPLRVQTLAAKP